MSNSVSSTSSLSQLQQLFPGAIQIDTRALAVVLGISAKTINNLGEKFPIRAVRFGRNKFYRLADTAHYIDNSLGIAPASTSTFAPEPAVTLVTQKKRGRGRPPKVRAVEVQA